MVRAAGERVARIGAARATRYAARRPIAGVGSQWPLYRIGADGRASHLGNLAALARGEFTLTDPGSAPAWLDTPTVYPDLPWFLYDARPSGFLGRAFAHQIADALTLPRDLTRWTADHTIQAWVHHGGDLVGNLVVGDAMLQRILDAGGSDAGETPVDDRANRYAALAERTMSGEAPGSSPGGEQPKFAARVRMPDGAIRGVLVKFSEATASPAKRRWCDLLVCEHLALDVLRAAGVPAATSELVVAGERLCLEVTRFDRVGARGRRGVVSLMALDLQFGGALDDWPRAAVRLAGAAWIAADTIEHVRALWWFGKLIANTDMHFENLSFFLDDARPLVPAPAYDMLPMLYRPAANGEVVPRVFAPAAPLPADQAAFAAAAPWALAFWDRVAADPRISLPFRRLAQDNREAVDALRARI
jgi:hypothetical protein